MANFTADYQALLDAPGYGSQQNRFKVNRMHGSLRLFESVFRAPPSGTAPAIGDKIIWGKLPRRVRVFGNLGYLGWNAGTASCTINLGDQYLATRHLAATAITSAGSAIPSAATISTTSGVTTTAGSNVLSAVQVPGAFNVGDIVTGTGIPAATYVTGVDFPARLVFLSANCTASATVTATVVGSAFETYDDSSSAVNNYASTTDDCTLISVVAGAQVANNQVIKLIMPYAMD